MIRFKKFLVTLFSFQCYSQLYRHVVGSDNVFIGVRRRNCMGIWFMMKIWTNLFSIKCFETKTLEYLFFNFYVVKQIWVLLKKQNCIWIALGKKKIRFELFITSNLMCSEVKQFKKIMSHTESWVLHCVRYRICGKA